MSTILTARRQLSRPVEAVEQAWLVVGFKRGTGGIKGVGYLRKMLDVVLFPKI